jgi:hypothetical protein
MSKERPILFSGPMILAILEGRKTQTRRVLKHPECYGCPTGDCPHSTQNECDQAMNDQSVIADSPYGVPGDRLWVRETWCQGAAFPIYKASCCDEKPSNNTDDWNKPVRDRWLPSIRMPRWASRITLEVMGVRVERLQSIQLYECAAEGARPTGDCDDGDVWDSTRTFEELWESINGEGSWDANPWVWVVEFKHVVQAVTA